MLQDELEQLIRTLPQKSVLLIGDYFLDEYLWVDPALAEISLETGLEAYQVVRRVREPGAAGTVANNLCTLGVGNIIALGLCGQDGEAFELKRALAARGVDVSNLIECANGMTPLYLKPIEEGTGVPRELNRLDIKNRTPLSSAVEEELIDRLRRLAPTVDAVVIADQVQEENCGVVTDRLRAELAQMALENPSVLFFADSRARIHLFSNIIVKPNEHELAALFDVDQPTLPLQELAAMGQELSRRTGKPVYVTCGSRGMILCTMLDVNLAAALPVDGPVDTVGAGDSVTSGIVCGLLAGLIGITAAELGNLTASITVQKLGTTGTASPGELRSRLQESGEPPAGLPITAEWLKRPNIGHGVEVIHSIPPSPLHSAIFDFDGTLSLIREGWQDVMIPFMVGELQATGTSETVETLNAVVREFVFRLTGKQTIYQMIQLSDEVKRRGGAAKDPQTYKDQYHALLWNRIEQRVAGLRSGAIPKEKYQVPGSIAFLEALRERGVKLYLASGTDLHYVEDEASALGFVPLFEGRIYGALPRREQFSKQMIIESILRDHSLQGPELAAFGDGYVEIENTRAVGGRSIGLATDEAHPGRLDGWKRNRLIAAGAHLIVPDFSEGDVILSWLDG